MPFLPSEFLEVNGILHFDLMFVDEKQMNCTLLASAGCRSIVSVVAVAGAVVGAGGL